MTALQVAIICIIVFNLVAALCFWKVATFKSRRRRPAVRKAE